VCRYLGWVTLEHAHRLRGSGGDKHSRALLLVPLLNKMPNEARHRAAVLLCCFVNPVPKLGGEAYLHPVVEGGCCLGASFHCGSFAGSPAKRGVGLGFPLACPFITEPLYCVDCEPFPFLHWGDCSGKTRLAFRTSSFNAYVWGSIIIVIVNGVEDVSTSRAAFPLVILLEEVIAVEGVRHPASALGASHIDPS
jgi:hypothetical protein